MTRSPITIKVKSAPTSEKVEKEPLSLPSGTKKFKALSVISKLKKSNKVSPRKEISPEKTKPLVRERYKTISGIPSAAKWKIAANYKEDAPPTPKLAEFVEKQFMVLDVSTNSKVKQKSIKLPDLSKINKTDLISKLKVLISSKKSKTEL